MNPLKYLKHQAERRFYRAYQKRLEAEAGYVEYPTPYRCNT